MSIEESVRLVDKGDIAVVEWDLVGEKVNKLSSPVMARFKEIVEELKASNYKAVVMISRKPNIFIAGADIEEIKKLKTKEDFRAVVEQGHEIINAFEDLPMPTLAAIHGPCLGGGCELSLACDYRIATDDKNTRIGLPEIKLGIIPGFGGCVRLPRVVGLQASLDIILAGKAVDSRKAHKIGLIDERVPVQLLEERAMALAELMAKGEKPKRQKHYKPKGAVDTVLDSVLGRPMVFKQARKMVMKQTKGFYPAPLAALRVVQKTYGDSRRARALEVEVNEFCDVAVTEISKHLINLFFVLESIKKQNGVSDPNVRGRDVSHMAVLGAGVMGGGVAYVAADKGIDVRMKDISNEALALGFKSARELWQKKLKRRRIDKFEFQQKMNLVSGGVDFSGFKAVDVVVEAIVEDMEIKKKVIAETASHCREDAVIVTNTSSLSVSEMAKAHPQPENFAGMHFFNPVDKMPLVEVIRGERTSDETTATIFNLAKKMGKTPVVVKDGPGFLVNRLLLPWMAEALFFLEEGLPIAKVDRIYTHEFGMPMGPFRLLDEVGLDVAVKVLKIFRDSLGERIQVSELTEKIKTSGRLGRKNGRGFYLYDDKGKHTAVDQTIYKEMGLGIPNGTVVPKEVIERGMLQMINEASAVLLQDRIVETPQELDLAMIMGTGFPPFRGGLLKYADELGSQYIVEELEMYATRLGVRYKPLSPMENMAKTGRSFYS